MTNKFDKSNVKLNIESTSITQKDPGIDLSHLAFVLIKLHEKLHYKIAIKLFSAKKIKPNKRLN